MGPLPPNPVPTPASVKSCVRGPQEAVKPTSVAHRPQVPTIKRTMLSSLRYSRRSLQAMQLYPHTKYVARQIATAHTKIISDRKRVRHGVGRDSVHRWCTRSNAAFPGPRDANQRSSGRPCPCNGYCHRTRPCHSTRLWPCNRTCTATVLGGPLPPHQPKNPPTKVIHALKQRRGGNIRNITPSNSNANASLGFLERPASGFKPKAGISSRVA